MNWVLIGFFFSISFSSLEQVEKYFGFYGVAIYLILVWLIIANHKFILTKIQSKFNNKIIFLLAALTFLVISMITVLVYPIANSGIVGGGSDEDSTIAAVHALLNKQYPYYVKTYLGNSLSQLPGAVILGFPFVIINSIEYENIFWLFAFYITLRLYVKNEHSVLLLLWFLIGLSPVVMQQFVTATNYVANSIHVLLFTLLIANLIPKQNVKSWIKLLVSILFGVSLSSRSNYLLIVPLLFSYLIQNSDWKCTLKYMLLVCLTFGLITIPFYLYDPANFIPLNTQNKFLNYESIFPYVHILGPLLSVILSVVLSFQKMKNNQLILLTNIAITQALPVLLIVILSSVSLGKIDFGYTSYGLHFMFFGALASWISLTDSKKQKI